MELKASTVTPRQAALILGIRLDSVYGLIWAGRLAAEKCDGRWLVDRAAVDARVRDRAMRRSLTHKPASNGRMPRLLEVAYLSPYRMSPILEPRTLKPRLKDLTASTPALEIDCQ